MEKPPAFSQEIDLSQLVERSTVTLCPDDPREKRLADYVAQIKNPYCYLEGKTVVSLVFSQTETTLEDCIARYLREQ